MKTSDFDYELPANLIAQHPPKHRDGARMLVVHRESGTLEHRVFLDISDYLQKGDVAVFNDTRVMPARVYGAKEDTGGKVELLVLEESESGVWDVLLRASRRPEVGSTIVLIPGKAKAVLLEDGEQGRAKVRIESDLPFLEVLDMIGTPPLPPYIRRKQVSDRQTREDRERYQTIFAAEPGAVAAPTAGLHFTKEVTNTMDLRGIVRCTVTLHVGLGTFRPVSAETVEDHQMDEERYSIPQETADKITRAHDTGGRVLAIGSTTARTLETAADDRGVVAASSGRSRLFIYPPYRFKVVDAMLTNFHLPRSTLLMMVSALAGRDLIMKAYEEAVREEYRFYSYGDCMLIL